MATDLTLSVEDRPGTLADIGEALGKTRVNIEGFAGFGVEGRGIIHVLVEDAMQARRALEDAGLKVEGESDAIVLDFSTSGDADRPGALGEMARKVANAGVNIMVSYVATKNRGVLVTSDNAKAMAALKM
jgi:hypothetical protein